MFFWSGIFWEPSNQTFLFQNISITPSCCLLRKSGTNARKRYTCLKILSVFFFRSILKLCIHGQKCNSVFNKCCINLLFILFCHNLGPKVQPKKFWDPEHLQILNVRHYHTCLPKNTENPTFFEFPKVTKKPEVAEIG